MAELRAQFRAIVFGITGIIVAFLVFRFIVDLINAPVTNILVSFIHTITDFLITPFKNIIIMPQTGPLIYLNIDVILAIMVYVLIAILFTEVVTSFLYPKVQDIIENLVDGVFKFFEFSLVIRIIFELFSILDKYNSPAFVKTIYAITGWSQGILFKIPFGDGFINLSAILALIIIVIIDSVVDSLIKSLSKQQSELNKALKPPLTQAPYPVMPQPIQPQQLQPQNIIINMPAQQPIIQQKIFPANAVQAFTQQAALVNGSQIPPFQPNSSTPNPAQRVQVIIPVPVKDNSILTEKKYIDVKP